MQGRDTKDNINKIKDDYADILGQMTGKKKPVPMYKIQRQLNEEQKEAVPCSDDEKPRNKVKRLCRSPSDSS